MNDEQPKHAKKLEVPEVVHQEFDRGLHSLIQGTELRLRAFGVADLDVQGAFYIGRIFFRLLEIAIAKGVNRATLDAIYRSAADRAYTPQLPPGITSPGGSS